MRLFFAAVAAIAFTATAAAAPDTDPCAQKRSSSVDLGSQKIVVTAITIPGPFPPEGGGDNCRLATAVFTIHSATYGYAEVTYAAPIIAVSYDLGHTEAPVPAAKMGSFLDEWIKVEVSTSDKAPALTDEGVSSMLSPEEFEGIRASKAAMVCYKESEHDTICLAPDQVGNLTELFRRDQS